MQYGKPDVNLQKRDWDPYNCAEVSRNINTPATTRVHCSMRLHPNAVAAAVGHQITGSLSSGDLVQAFLKSKGGEGQQDEFGPSYSCM